MVEKMCRTQYHNNMQQRMHKTLKDWLETKILLNPLAYLNNKSF